MSIRKKRSRYYLHLCYHAGYDASIENDEECPHCLGTNEHTWWWYGWNDGAAGSIRGYMKRITHGMIS